VVVAVQKVVAVHVAVVVVAVVVAHRVEVVVVRVGSKRSFRFNKRRREEGIHTHAFRQERLKLYLVRSSSIQIY